MSAVHILKKNSVPVQQKAALLIEQNNRLAHSQGYLANYGAKFDVIFLFGDPDFL